MKITRRKLAGSLAAVAVARAAQAQTSQTANAGDRLQTARDRQRANGDALAKFEIPMSVEPAFQFKA